MQCFGVKEKKLGSMMVKCRTHCAAPHDPNLWQIQFKLTVGNEGQESRADRDNFFRDGTCAQCSTQMDNGLQKGCQSEFTGCPLSEKLEPQRSKMKGRTGLF